MNKENYHHSNPHMQCHFTFKCSTALYITGIMAKKWKQLIHSYSSTYVHVHVYKIDNVQTNPEINTFTCILKQAITTSTAF